MSDNRQKKITIYDVAELAGVSLKTVSRVINREAGVREKTEAKVKRAIEKLNYQPSQSARGLAANKSFLVGLLYANPSAGYIIQAQAGALESCRRYGFGLVILPCNYQAPNLVESLLEQIRESRLDGVVLTPPLSDSGALRLALTRAGILYACVAGTASDKDELCVDCDDETAAQAMTKYLLDLGHTRIAHILGHPDHGASAQRYRGYRHALSDAGIELDEKWVAQGYFDFESGKQCANQLLALENPPTAIFAASDDMASAVLVVAHERGLHVPGDVSVVGFDDAPHAAQTWPALTTIQQPIAAMVAMATELLILRVRQQPVTECRSLMSCQLIVRQSAGMV